MLDAKTGHCEAIQSQHPTDSHGRLPVVCNLEGLWLVQCAIGCSNCGGRGG